MATRLAHLVVDAADPGALARFWAAALGWPVTDKDPIAVTRPPEGGRSQAGQLPLVFVPVDEPKTSKNRVHLDLASRSAEDQVALVARLEDLGARKLDIGQGPDVTWEVMADPEGNELCVVSHAGSVGSDPASAFGSLWPVAAIVLDSPDPDAVAPFWAAATGWPILGRDGTHVWLRDTAAAGPYLDIRRNDDPKTTKLRVHPDVVPHPTDDHATEVDRLVALGAHPTDIGQGDVPWAVLADPQGNELCVLTPW